MAVAEPRARFRSRRRRATSPRAWHAQRDRNGFSTTPPPPPTSSTTSSSRSRACRRARRRRRPCALGVGVERFGRIAGRRTILGGEVIRGCSSTRNDRHGLAMPKRRLSATKSARCSVAPIVVSGRPRSARPRRRNGAVAGPATAAPGGLRRRRQPIRSLRRRSGARAIMRHSPEGASSGKKGKGRRSWSRTAVTPLFAARQVARARQSRSVPRRARTTLPPWRDARWRSQARSASCAELIASSRQGGSKATSRSIVGWPSEKSRQRSRRSSPWRAMRSWSRRDSAAASSHAAASSAERRCARSAPLLLKATSSTASGFDALQIGAQQVRSRPPVCRRAGSASDPNRRAAARACAGAGRRKRPPQLDVALAGRVTADHDVGRGRRAMVRSTVERSTCRRLAGQPSADSNEQRAAARAG